MAIIKINVIRQTLNKAIAYISDWGKTRNGMQISTNCSATPWDPKNVAEDMQINLDAAESHRNNGRPGEVLAYHVIQSFAPGEVQPFVAHDIGVEFVERITGGEYDYVIATHEDRDHIHNHIIFSSVNRTTWKRYRSQKRRVWEYREISDELCRKHGLSVIENPSRKRQSLGELYAGADGRSTKQMLMNEIDKAVASSFSWKAMTDSLKAVGIDTYVKGNNVLFLNPQTMGKSIRGKTLGPSFTEAALQARLGRQAVTELVVQKQGVSLVDTERARVKVPWKRGHTITIPRECLTDHGATWRVFLPETMTVTMLDGKGNLAGQYEPEQLYQFYSRPDVLRDMTVRTETARRGKTAAQERYFKHIDKEVEALRDDATMINLMADYHALTPDDQQPFMDSLASQIDRDVKELQRLQAGHQQALDAGKKGKSEELHRQARQVRNLQAAYNKITKERTLHERRTR